MKIKNWLLAYCPDNQATAARFNEDLSKAGILFSHYTCSQTSDNSSMAKELLQKEGDIFLMISDNFLKSSYCMVDALELLSKGLQQKRIQAIVIDSEVQAGPGQPIIRKPTQFSRISDLISYMNFWQERYLKLRKSKDTILANQAEEFEKELKRVRVISAEIGEFLRMLRDTDYWSMDKLQEDHYALFFNKIGKQDLIIPFQKTISDSDDFTSEEEEWTSVKKELKLTTQPEDEGPTDPEELEAIRLSQLKEEELKTKNDLSSIFEEGKAEDAIPEEKENEATTQEVDKDSETFSEWDDIVEQDTFDNDLTLSMTSRFFEKIDKLIERGEEFAAAKELKQFLQVNKKSAEAHYRLALLEAGNENYASARKHSEHAVSLQPDQPAYHLALGRVLFHHFVDEPKLAEQSFKKALQLNPANKTAHYEYAMLLHEVLDKTQKAINQLELTLAIDPKHPFANYDLALIYYSLKKTKKAAAYYEKAFSVNPELRTPDNDIAFWYESYLTHEEPQEKDLPLQKEGMHVITEKELLESYDEVPDIVAEETLETKKETMPEVEQEAEPEPAMILAPQKQQIIEVKTILITGATSGIGKATAELFARYGHRLILTGRREKRLDKFKQELEVNFQSEVYTLAFDVRYQSAAKKSLNSLPEEWQQIDLLINNAGLAKGFDPIHEGDLKHWEIMLDTNIKGLLFITRIISPRMVERGSGQIINICSSAGHEVYPKGAVYCASKYAVDALTKGMRLDLHQYGIRVGQVSPGHVEETEFAVVRFDGDKERAKIYEDFQPLKSTDVAAAIYFMASQPPHVNIQDIQLMGTQQASNVFIDRSGRTNA